MGFEIWKDPGLLKPQLKGQCITFTHDNGTNEDVSIEALTECYQKYSDLFSFLDDWDSGIVTISFSEYQHLPAKLMDCRRLFRKLKC